MLRMFNTEIKTMRLRTKLVSSVSLVLIIALVIHLAGCGTIIYPERRGQTTGRIDIGIAILDAAWLIVFIIPGVVAFGVDFATGAIYMPSARHKPQMEAMTVIRLHPDDLHSTTIEDVVTKYTGCSERICLARAEAYAMDSHAQLAAKLAELQKSGYRTH
jgi:hypothetical protein